MARVHNWQIGRDMSYWYPESRPKKQFAAIFDVNKCISCQTCNLACKTTWTSGKGQEYMLWNNVESKPYCFYPLAWDVRVLETLGPQPWSGGAYDGRTLFEAASAGERVLGWRPEDLDFTHPNIGEDDCAGVIDNGADLQVPHLTWFFYLARICNHCTYPACLASCPRGSIYKRPEDGIVLLDKGRCRGYRECVKACPYKKVFYNAMTGTSEKCIACFPKIEMGQQPQCFVNCIRVQDQGALSLVPHPFCAYRSSAIRRDILQEVIGRVDIMEGYNARVLSDDENMMARDFAAEHKKPISVGSDAHTPLELGRCSLQLSPIFEPEELIRELQEASVRFRLMHHSIHYLTKVVKLARSIRKE